MTKPDEALLWAREERVKFWEQSNASRKDIAMHVAATRAGDYDRNLHDDVYLRRSWLDGHRAGAAASEARIKALEAEVRELKEALTATVMQAAVRQIPITNEIKFSAPIRAQMKEHEARPMTGFVATLTAEQKQAAMTYEGDDHHGPNTDAIAEEADQ